MNVQDANKIVDQVAYLRENIYTDNIFKNAFCDMLRAFLNSESEVFTENELGGYIVTVVAKELNPQAVGAQVVNALNEAYKPTIVNIDPAYTNLNFYMLINVVIAGNDTIEIFL